RNLDGQAGERHERVHKVGILLAPHPRVHPAHRSSSDQPQVIHAQVFGEPPWPMPSGRMMKYLVASSSCPGPNSTPAKFSERNPAPEPPVPCMMRTALVALPEASRSSVPTVR